MTPNYSLQRLVGEIAARHGIRLAVDDPAMIIVTLNQLFFEETIKGLSDYVSKMEESIDNAGRKVERRAGLILSQEVRESASAVRQELQKDIDTASLRAEKIVDDLHRVDSNGCINCTRSVGLYCIVLTFGLGVVIGWSLCGVVH